MLSEDEINNRFGFHKATIEGANATQPKHADLRQRFMEFAKYLDEVLPDAYPELRLKRLAFDQLEVASMWSHKSIAQSAPLSED